MTDDDDDDEIHSLEHDFEGSIPMIRTILRPHLVLWNGPVVPFETVLPIILVQKIGDECRDIFFYVGNWCGDQFISLINVVKEDQTSHLDFDFTT